jgi:deoxyribonuclease-4
MLLGAHVPIADALGGAAERGAEVVQVFLSSPRMWAPPKPRADAEVLRDAGLPLYVHSPYLLNLASADEVVRTRSLELLQATCAAAEVVGALGVVVHGGQLGAGEEPALGPARWRAALERLETAVPVLIEDTAGGPHAVASSVERIARLWDGLEGVGTPLGFCLDTCHLHAAGEDLVQGTERLLAVLGRIDLVHVNDSKDPVGSGRDRHENLGAGHLDAAALIAVLELADAPSVVETPGGADQQAADLAWLRARLAAPAA